MITKMAVYVICNTRKGNTHCYLWKGHGSDHIYGAKYGFHPEFTKRRGIEPVCKTCWRIGQIQKDCPDCNGTGIDVPMTQEEKLKKIQEKYRKMDLRR